MQADNENRLEGYDACILVLGDIGRSPRMCNHAVALAREGFNVTVIGYGGSTPNQHVTTSPNIKLEHLQPFPKWMSRWLPRPISLLLKTFWQLFTILFTLPILRAPHFILMQNPPSIPTLIIGRIYAWCHRRTKLVLDWHNYGYSIMELSFGDWHPLVKLAKSIEAFFGPKVHAAFCVSKAMKRKLHDEWGIEATVLYDRPTDSFRSCSDLEKYRLLQKLSVSYPNELDPSRFMETGKGNDDDNFSVRLKAGRPGILVSSTSWTEDEDFSILFEALDQYESRFHVNSMPMPDLVCVITGRGPQKEYFRKLIDRQSWQHVQVIMPWLEPEDYPLMLASADLGVCLHTSSSGVDLPMKVVDMFGCRLPVVAKHFPALGELVKDGFNGYHFNTSEDLATKIVQWFEDYPHPTYINRRRPFTQHLERNNNRATSWPEYWRAVALPMFLELLPN